MDASVEWPVGQWGRHKGRHPILLWLLDEADNDDEDDDDAVVVERSTAMKEAKGETMNKELGNEVEIDAGNSQ